MNSNQGRSAPWLAAVTSRLFLLIFCFLPSCSSSSSISSPPPPPPTSLHPSHLTLPAIGSMPTPPRALPFPSHSLFFPPQEGGSLGESGQQRAYNIWASCPSSRWEDGRTLLHLFIPFLLIYSFPFHASIQKAFFNTHKGPNSG